MIKENLSAVLDRVHSAALKAGRDPRTVKIVAASKKQSAQAMNDLKDCLEEAGCKVIFGESYLQDFKSKEASLKKPYELHIIGPLQSNKVKEAVKISDCIESAHSIKILDEINKAAHAAGKTQRIFIQINISRDEAKSGFLPAQVDMAIEHIDKKCSSLALEGLMTITRFYEKREDVRPDFRAMKELAGRAGRPLELSMGMSDDFDIAIEEGATFVRIGTALFGERK